MGGAARRWSVRRRAQLEAGKRWLVCRQGGLRAGAAGVGRRDVEGVHVRVSAGRAGQRVPRVRDASPWRGRWARAGRRWTAACTSWCVRASAGWRRPPTNIAAHVCGCARSIGRSRVRRPLQKSRSREDAVAGGRIQISSRMSLACAGCSSQPSCVQDPFGPANERLATNWHREGVLGRVRRAILLGSVRKSMPLIDHPDGEARPVPGIFPGFAQRHAQRVVAGS